MSPLPAIHVSHENGAAGHMIRKNPRGGLPVVHDGAVVDPTAILCGRAVVHENVSIGPCAGTRADTALAIRLETSALRSTSAPVSLSPVGGRSGDKEQLADAAAR